MISACSKLDHISKSTDIKVLQNEDLAALEKNMTLGTGTCNKEPKKCTGYRAVV